MRYADASVIASAYLPDEPEHVRWRGQILEGADPVVSTELVRAEVASAIAAAARAARIPSSVMTSRFEADCAPGGPIQLLSFESGRVLDRAVRLVEEHQLRAMDAIHLAVALEQALPLAQGEPIAFLTGDRRRAAAAKALGFADPADPAILETMARLTDVDEGEFLRSDH